MKCKSGAESPDLYFWLIFPTWTQDQSKSKVFFPSFLLLLSARPSVLVVEEHPSKENIKGPGRWMRALVANCLEMVEDIVMVRVSAQHLHSHLIY